VDDDLESGLKGTPHAPSLAVETQESNLWLAAIEWKPDRLLTPNRHFAPRLPPVPQSKKKLSNDQAEVKDPMPCEVHFAMVGAAALLVISNEVAKPPKVEKVLTLVLTQQLVEDTACFEN
jgi:hypothetical protein